VFHPTPTVNRRLKFTAYVSQFCSGYWALQSAHELHWIMFLGWGAVLHVVCAAHLLGLQLYAGNFETGQQGEMVCGFS
jgi:hypothetical protein